MPHADGLLVNMVADCDACAVVRVSGALDHTGEQYFRTTMGGHVDVGYRYVVLDCSALVYCNSRGLNCLLGLHWLLSRRHGRLLLACVGRRVQWMLDNTGSREVLAVFPTVTRALASLPVAYRPAWPPPHPVGAGPGG
ncbi:STAS domain-containing protein [Streptomyces sp. NPDC018019]|uniref:STAS domain-containing protein n=1 Tax=Streptomyces sp. NPDC018019 TaxID=3365030 RepID=UPI00378B438B